MKPKLFYIGQPVMVDPDCRFVGEESIDPAPGVVYHVANYVEHPHLPRWMIHLVEFPHNGEYWTAWDEGGFVPVDEQADEALAELLAEQEAVLA